MSAHGGIERTKHAGPRHECLAAAAFLARTAEDLDRSLLAGFLEISLYGERRRDGIAAVDMMSAGMAVPAGGILFLHRDLGDLAQIRNRIEFGNKTDLGMAGSVRRDECRRQSADVILDPETVFAQIRGQGFERFVFPERDLCALPDRVRQFDDLVLFRIDHR